MNKKSSKLLAAVAILAMVACAFVAVAPVDSDAAAPTETNVAKIGETGYATLDAAIAAAESGETIELVKNTSLTASVSIPAGVTLKISASTALDMVENSTHTLTVPEGAALNIYGTISNASTENILLRGTGVANLYKGGNAIYDTASFFPSAAADSLVAVFTDYNDESHGFIADVKQDMTLPEGGVILTDVLVINTNVTVSGGAITNSGSIFNFGEISSTITNGGTYLKGIDAFDTETTSVDAVSFIVDGYSTGIVGIVDSNYKGWAYGDNSEGEKVLVLNGYNGTDKFAFTENVTIELVGENTIDRSKATADNDIAVSASNHTLNILGDGSLTINENNGKTSRGILAGEINIGEATIAADAEGILTVAVNGGNQAIRAGSGITVQNAIVNATGNEKGVRIDGSATAKLIINNGAVVTAKSNGSGANDETANDYTGTKAPKVEVTGGSLTTYGLYAIGSVTVSGGELIVKYDENAKRDAGTVKVNESTSYENIAMVPGLYVATLAESANPDVVGTLTISGGKVTVEQGNIIVANVENVKDEVTSEILFAEIDRTATIDIYGSKNVIEAVMVTSNVVIVPGSVNFIGGIEGVNWVEDADGITIEGNVEISGTFDVPIAVAASATVTVPAGQTLTINKNVTVESGATMNVLGDLDGIGTVMPATGASNISITANNPAVVQQMVTGGLVVGTSAVIGVFTPSNPANIATDETNMESLLASSNIIVIDADTYTLKFDVTIPAGITLYLNGCALTVEKDVDLAINGGKVQIGVPANYTGTVGEKSNSLIHVDGNLLLDGADICAPVEINEDTGYVNIANPIVSEISKNVPNTFDVGYGNTLTLSDASITAGMVVTVYGKLELNGEVTVTNGAVLNVAKSGTVDINGTLKVNGTMSVKGIVYVDGTLNVTNDNGGALFEVSDEKAEVEVNGTMTVAKPKSATATKVNAVSVKDGVLAVKGTMTVTGQISGIIHDMGTMSINGTSKDATVVIYDGITLTVTSVSGTLYVSDEGICDESVEGVENSIVMTGNKVALTGVKGVTVSTAVTSKTVEVNKVKYKTEVANMTVTGTVTAVDKNDDATSVSVQSGTTKASVTGKQKDNTAIWSDDIAESTITVIDMTLGEDVDLKFVSGEMIAAGAINAVAKEIEITTGASVTVTGTITVGGENTTTEMNYNGVGYTITDATNGAETQYITTLENAVVAAPNADDGEVTVYGEIEVVGELTIPAGVDVILSTDAQITITGTITVEVDGLLSGAAGVIIVDGKLIINDKNSGLTYSTKAGAFQYQVYTENGDVATYTGLAGALASAKPGDVITLMQGAVIDEDLEIPAEVTLVIPAAKYLTIDNSEGSVKLTVNGTLDVQKKGILQAVGNTDDKKSQTEDRADLVINGVFMYAEGNDTEAGMFFPYVTDYAYFEKKVDGVNYLFGTNLTYAAANCNDGEIEIEGNVTAGDITLTPAENKEVALTIPADATVVVKSITLVGNDTMVAVGGELTGDVVVDATAGKSVVTLAKTSGFVLSVKEETGADGKIITMNLNGTATAVDGIEGQLTVSQGTIYIENLRVGDCEKDVMTIAAGATVIVEKDKKLHVSYMETSNPTAIEPVAGLIVNGTLDVNGGTVEFYGIVDIVGTVDIDKNGTMETYNKEVNVTGSIVIADENTKVEINSDIKVGSASDTLGAIATVAGPMTINEWGSVVVYSDGDVSKAKLNYVNDESAAKSTVYVINGSDYMTVYVSTSTKVTNGMLIPVEITGYEPVYYWYAKADYKITDTPVNSISVGVYEIVYSNVEPSPVGGTISEGTGITLYIDGMTITNFVGSVPNYTYAILVGEHTVSYDVATGYDGKDVVITFNGVTVQNGGTFEVTADMEKFTLLATGAVPASGQASGSDGMGLTDILLIVLVVLIAIMAVVIAMRMMRS